MSVLKEKVRLMTQIEAIEQNMKSEWNIYGIVDRVQLEGYNSIIVDVLQSIVQSDKWVCPIKLVYGDDSYYSISKDEIVVPEKDQFKCIEYFIGTLAHELVHSTGSELRLNRLKPTSYGSAEYAREELVAELAASCFLWKYGIRRCIKEDSIPYIRNWKECIESDEYVQSVLKDVANAITYIDKQIDSFIIGETAQTKDIERIQSVNIFKNKDGEYKIQCRLKDCEKRIEIRSITKEQYEIMLLCEDMKKYKNNLAVKIFRDVFDSKEECNPIVKQYTDIKKKHPDAIILFRTGDMYITYDSDAKDAADILGIKVTQNHDVKDENGNPFKSAEFSYIELEKYLPRLIRAGKRVAICDQIENPERKKFSKRCVSENVKPSVVVQKEPSARAKELMKCKEHYLRIIDNIDHIELHTKNGEKHGIGNPHAIKVVMDAMLAEIDKQIKNS